MTILEIPCGCGPRAAVPVAWIGFVTEGGEQIIAASGTKPTPVTAASSFASRIRDATDLVIVPTRRQIRVSRRIRWSPDLPISASTPPRPSATAARCRSSTARRARSPPNRSRSSRASPATPRASCCCAQLVRGERAIPGLLRAHQRPGAQPRPDGTLLHANEAANTPLGISRGAPLVQAAEPDRRDELRGVLTASSRPRRRAHRDHLRHRRPGSASRSKAGCGRRSSTARPRSRASSSATSPTASSSRRSSERARRRARSRAGEDAVPHQRQPRDPHADERHRRHDRPAHGLAAERGAAGLRAPGPRQRRPAPVDRQQHPLRLEPRGGNALRGDGGLRPLPHACSASSRS